MNNGRLWTGKRWGRVGAVMALLTALIWTGSGQPVYAVGEEATATVAQSVATLHTVSVIGKGEVKATPDVAYINLGIVTKGKTAKEAQAANAAQFAKLKQALTTNQIAAADILTTSFNVYPEYDYTNGTNPKLTGYTANHSIQVTYRNMDGIGKLLDIASGAGVNQVNGIQFDIGDPAKYEDEALKLAMAEADRKANVLAQAAKQQVVTVLHITESQASITPFNSPMYSQAKAEAADATSTAIQTGQITISTNVTVEYQIK